MVSIRFQGGDDLAAAMLKLPQRLRKPTLVKVLTEAAQPMRARMAATAPRSDRAPHIADNIVVSTVRKFDGVAVWDGEAAVGVGPARGFNYGLLLEFGFKAPRPFVRAAYDEGRAEALQEIGRGLWDELRAVR